MHDLAKFSATCIYLSIYMYNVCILLYYVLHVAHLRVPLCIFYFALPSN